MHAGVAVNHKPLKIENPLIYFIHGCTDVRDLKQIESVCLSGAMDSTPDLFRLDYSHVACSSHVRSSRFFSPLIYIFPNYIRYYYIKVQISLLNNANKTTNCKHN